jgi:pyruvate dehydrogenase E2 component (dihydrolipoamide acetyltransferase)
MAQQVIIPQFGTSVDRVTILSWKAGQGDTVKKGDLLCEVETDKSALEIESFFTGTLLKVLAEEGSEVGIGEIIAYIGEPGEKVPDAPAGQSAAAAASLPPAEASASPAGQTMAGNGGAVQAMPKARRLARQMKVDIAAVRPAGSGGVVTEADVRRAAVERITASNNRNVIELSKNQRAVASRVKQSYGEIIPITLTATINMDTVMKARGRSAEKPSFDAYFVYAAARAMEKYPTFQYFCSGTGDGLIHAGGPHVGVAVSSGDELYIPVIKNPAAVRSIDSQIREFQRQAESNQLRQDDLEDGVLLLSNLGMYPVDTFTLIIPPRYSGALSIGRVRASREPLLYSGDATIESHVVTVQLAVDHRFINGRLAAEFVTELKRQIELFGETTVI